MYIVVNKWNPNKGWYVIGIAADDQIVFEIHDTGNTQDGMSELRWRYVPRKRDGRNEDRIRIFEQKAGKVDVTLPWPADEAEAVTLIDELSAIATVRKDADALVRRKSAMGEKTLPPTRMTIEGRLRERNHMFRERDPRLVGEAKALFRAKHGRLFCEVCRFCFVDEYGTDFIEAHHTRPLSDLDPTGEQMSARDIAMVCSNCHSMIHLRRPWLSIDELKHCRKSARLAHECAKLDPSDEQRMAN